MTREAFLKRKWKGYEIIHYTNPRTEEVLEMSIISINFDNEMIECILAMPEEDDWPPRTFFVPLQFISVPFPKPKLAM